MPVVRNNTLLKERLAGIEGNSFITVDTEFVREKTYYPKLCLIQIATKDYAFAVDVLEDGLDLEPLWQVFRNKDIVKVFHSCTQDLEILLHIMGELPHPVYDTQVAAQILGYGEALGYSNLVKKILNQSIDKSSRYTDWSRRPLSEKQISYALSDVTYLYDIYPVIHKEIDEAGRNNWMKEEMEQYLDPTRYKIEPEFAWKKLKIRASDAKFIIAAKKLAKWREQTAQTSDKPRQWILRDDALLEIASVRPNKLAKLKSMRSAGSLPNHLANEILEVLQNEEEHDYDGKLHKKKYKDKPSEAAMDLLRVLLKSCAEKNSIAASVVATTEDLERILLSDDANKLPVMQGWRNEVFGKFATKLLAGKLSMRLVEDKVEFSDKV
jgi:ribonuclease D